MSTDFKNIVLDELALFLEPVRAAGVNADNRQALLAALGWILDETSGSPGDLLRQNLEHIVASIDAVQDLAGDSEYSLSDVVKALVAIGKLFDDVIKLSSINTGGLPDLEKFGEELVKALVMIYLQAWHPVVYYSLALLTVVKPDDAVKPTGEIKDSGGNIIRKAYRPATFDLERIKLLLSDPVKELKTEYFPNGFVDNKAAQDSAALLFPRLSGLLDGLGAITTYSPPDPNGNANAALIIGLPKPPPTGDFIPGAPETESSIKFEFSAPPKATGLVITPSAQIAYHPKADGWDFSFALAANTSFVVGPNGLTDGNAGIRGELSVAKVSASPTEPALRIGEAKGTCLQIGQVKLTGTFAPNTNPKLAEYGLLAEVTSAAVIINAGDGDGFLQKILPPDGLRIDFDLGLGYSNQKGVYFRGSAGLEVTLPLHLSLFNVINIDSVYLGILISDKGIAIAAATGISLNIGPVFAAIEQMGLRALVSFPKNKGNLGPLNLDLGFKPPNGIALSLDASAVVGGGYLFFDFDKEQYAGVLMLSIQKTLTLKAIGLLTTRMPDGSEGFSLLIIISAEFSPIQLGFGFTLNGVGGLAGINRTVVTDALRAGLKKHALDHILFPKEVVKNAKQIVSDLQTFFPPTPDYFVFGPMLEIGWGTPTLVTIELGVILQIPQPVIIVLLGQISALLPKPDKAVIEIHLDVLGVLDFGKQLFSLDATLYDSKIAIFSISGQMAMRLKWGDDPTFMLSIGGYNPAFDAPADFPKLDRFQVALSSSENPRLGMQAYLAITSNTFQTGAAAFLAARAGDFSLEGYLGFNALFYFKPFSFITDFSAGIALKYKDTELLGIHLAASLSGPAPWHAWGKASISILFFDITVDFDATWGDVKQIELPGVDPSVDLLKALNDPRNWSGALPAAAFQSISLSTPQVKAQDSKSLDPPAFAFVDPVGVLVVREKVLPLDHQLTKYGEAKPVGTDRYTIDKVTSQDKNKLSAKVQLAFEPLTDQFAPAQFEEMSDAEKLSRRSFEPMQAGVKISNNYLDHKPGVSVTVSYLTEILDSYTEARSVADYQLSVTNQIASTQRSAGAQSALTNTGNQTYVSVDSTTSPAVQLAPEKYLVVDINDLQPRTDVLAKSATQARAYQAMQTYQARHPRQAFDLEVVPEFEIASP